MRASSIDRLRCPVCVREGVESAYELDPTRVGGGEDGGAAGDLVEGFLVCLRCRAARPVVAGVAIVVLDLDAHLVAHGNVFRRVPIADPRVTRFVLGGAGMGGDVVPFDEVVARYGDLLPILPPSADASDVMPARSPSPYDVALAAALDPALASADGAGPPAGPALEIGCGVGRGTFTLAARCGDATGVDRSVARVRRARNVQTAEQFLLPAEPGARVETPIALEKLRRDAVDFVVADAEALPFPSATFGFVVLREGDGDGPWRDKGRAAAEAARVLAVGGVLLVEATVFDGSHLLAVVPGRPDPHDARPATA